jgi:signal peptidase I
MPTKKKTKPSGKAKTNKTTRSSIKTISWFKALFIAILILLALRTFFVQSIIIQNSTMSGNLLPGDWVVINKAAYGSRMPITMFSVPFSPLRVNNNSPKLYSAIVALPYFRLSGYSPIHNNDIVAFNYPDAENTPVDKKIVYAKRCVAIPGDTIKILNNQLLVNDFKIDIDNLQFLYRLKVKGKNLKQSTVEKYNINEGGAINNFGEYDVFISNKQAEELRMEPGIAMVSKERKLQDYDKGLVYPHDEKLNWTLDNYGPYIIPKAGTGIPITKNNVSLYRDILEKFEKCIVTLDGDKVLINNNLLNSYFFKYNYYFVLDDNRDNAKDSRLWGLLPETHIIGKIAFIASSFDPSKKGISKIRWSRTLKKVK